MNRRNLLVGTTSALIVAPAVWTSARASQKITIADAGGAVTERNKQFYYDPFQKATGIEVVPVTRRGSPASDIKLQVETKNNLWDFCGSISGDVVVALMDDGYLEEHGVTGANYSAIPADLKNKFYVPEIIPAFVNCYRTDTIKKPLSSMADIWDPSIKGVRSLRRTARDTIEVALRADGVKGGDDIYKILNSPAGWDRAFAKLDQIKPRIRTWWSAAAESARLLQTGEVDILPTYSNRAQELIDAKLPVRIAWEEGFYLVNGWVIPKGSAKVELVRKFIEFALEPKRQAEACAASGSGPANPETVGLIEESRRVNLTTYEPNFKKMAKISDEFWAVNQDKAQQRFNSWLLA
ncbi:hypothetical protein AXW83_18130 [Bosea sp. PAMC 26642]|nr:hypothetical protein AXW83_18130 [Bosea sp. PAMC 26642]